MFAEKDSTKARIEMFLTVKIFFAMVNVSKGIQNVREALWTLRAKHSLCLYGTQYLK
jgi:hypothetical protein